jgi:hypothetical protein
MATYTIQVVNRSGFNKAYTILMASPRVNRNGEPLKAYTNAWATFPSLPDNGFDKLVIDAKVYAFWGQAQDLEPGVVVVPHGVTLVSTADRDQVAFTNMPNLGFQDVTSGKADTGCYAIATGTDFTAANGFVFGVAKVGLQSSTAVGTFAAEPNDIFNIAPVQRFYVADLAAVPGEIIDLSDLTAVATIDFTGLPQTTAVAIQDADGQFSVIYS